MRTTLSSTARKFLDNVHGLIVVLSEKGNVEFVNLYAAQLLGFEREEMIGKNWFDHFVPRDKRKETRARFKEVLKGKVLHETYKNQYLKTKKGDLHLIEWHETYLQDKDKNIIGTFSSGEDVTEKHMLKLYLADQQAKHRQDRLTAIVEAAEKERQFLAYELHDGVNQVLTTCKLLLEAELNQKESPFVQRAFNHIQEVINTLRALSHELNPGGLGNEGLFASAQQLVERMNATGKIEVKMEARGLDLLKGLCPHISLSLYRIMQEALTNISKHAGAKKVLITLTSSPGAVDLEIEDDGKGFDHKSSIQGLGLKTIHTRAEAAGGKALVTSCVGEGTLLSIHIPFQFEVADDADESEQDGV